MQLADSSILPNLLVPGSTLPDTSFEKKYLACRSSEHRIYTDEEVLSLPECPAHHPHAAEWAIRKHSAGKLIRLLADRHRPLRILEVGCGNGWLSHRLSIITGSRVTGIDINFTELQQAARIFSHCHNLSFIYGDINAGILGNQLYDVIVFAASIQYFSRPEHTLHICMQHLDRSGELHIVDSNFYASEAQAQKARERSVAYYQAIGCPGMTAHYFHHSLAALSAFRYQVNNHHGALRSRLFGTRNPFPWITIKQRSDV